jgi:hypothetical protein
VAIIHPTNHNGRFYRRELSAETNAVHRALGNVLASRHSNKNGLKANHLKNAVTAEAVAAILLAIAVVLILIAG